MICMRDSICLVLGFSIAVGACAGDSSDTADGTGGATDAGTDAAAIDCSSATTQAELVVCAAEAFEATLSDSEKETLLYDWSDATAKTTWSNLPGVARNGLAYGDLESESQAALLVLAQTVL